MEPTQRLRDWMSGPPRVTQRALAERLRLHQTAVGRILAGNRRPGLTLAFEIEKLTGIPAKAWREKRRAA